MTVPTGEGCLLDYAAVCRELRDGLTRCGLSQCTVDERAVRVAQGYRLVLLWRWIWRIGGGLTVAWIVWR